MQQDAMIGSVIIKLDEVGSTNEYMTTHLSDFKEGAIVSASTQINGKGQRGNVWLSDPGKNLIISILLHPTFLRAEQQFMLSKAVSLGIREFVEDKMRAERSGDTTGYDVTIKWPNDICVNGRKVAGILIESSVAGSTMQHSVVGIGLNINQVKFPATLKSVTSLSIESGRDYNLDVCLEELCKYLEKYYDLIRNESFDLIHKLYVEKLYKYQKWSNFKSDHGSMKARIIGIAPTGKLMIEKEGGEVSEYGMKEIVYID